MRGTFAHIDPTKTFIYKEYTVVYGFDTGSRCFTCRVRNGYLTGKRADLPEDLAWMIGQHIDTVKLWVHNLMPLRLA